MVLLEDCPDARPRRTSRGCGRGASLKSQILTAVVVLVGCTGLASLALAGLTPLPANQDAAARAPAQTEGTSARRLDVAAADRVADRAAQPSTAIIELRRDRIALQHRLAAHERRLAEILRERRHTDAKIEHTRNLKAEAEDRLSSAPSSRRVLQQRAEAAAARLDALLRQRRDGLHAERNLRSQIARLESRLAGLTRDREAVRQYLKEWMVGGVEALQQLFVGTSVDLDVLLERAAGADGSGLGGPLEGLDGMTQAEVIGHASDAMAERIRQLSALQKVASSLPLASPLDEFVITSTFGKRRDPFTRAPAFHPGLDFGAAAGSEIAATAPGRVIRAEPSGPYGVMVEIDHGLGVITRYGHLKTVLVEEGDDVRARQPIGVIGSTGRSTGRHMHYEIRIDGVAFDPARFLEAGRYLVDTFGHEPVPIGADGS